MIEEKVSSKTLLDFFTSIFKRKQKTTKKEFKEHGKKEES